MKGHITYGNPISTYKSKERIMRIYKCKHCKNTVLRDSKKAWIKSYCDKIGKNVHLIKQKEK